MIEGVAAVGLLALAVVGLKRYQAMQGQAVAQSSTQAQPVGFEFDFLDMGNLSDSLGVYPVQEETQPVDVSANMPRGIRNNNPGNVRYTGTQWQGLSNPPSDGEYCIFTDPRYGIRAMGRILNSYASRGIDSISEIIFTWAPPSENNTLAYVAHVADLLEWSETLPLPLDKRPELVAAIIKHENGINPYSMATINEGLSWA